MAINELSAHTAHAEPNLTVVIPPNAGRHKFVSAENAGMPHNTPQDAYSGTKAAALRRLASMSKPYLVFPARGYTQKPEVLGNGELELPQTTRVLFHGHP